MRPRQVAHGIQLVWTHLALMRQKLDCIVPRKNVPSQSAASVGNGPPLEGEPGTGPPSVRLPEERMNPDQA